MSGSGRGPDLDGIEAQAKAATSGSVFDEESSKVASLADIPALVAEVRRLRDNARRTAQVLIAEAGADGPMSALEAAERAVDATHRLREEARLWKALWAAEREVTRHARRSPEWFDALAKVDAVRSEMRAGGIDPDAPEGT